MAANLKPPSHNDPPLTILQWNCRGVMSKLCELKSFIQSHRPDVILLNETMLNAKVCLRVAGFCVVRADRLVGRGGGVAILIRDSLPFHPVALPHLSLEATAVKVYLSGGSVHIACFYDPTGSAPRVDFTSLESACGNTFVIAGDANAHSPLWGCLRRTAQGTLIEDWLLTQSFAELLNTGEDTYQDPHRGTRSALDLTLASANLAADYSWQPITAGSSDHRPILCRFYAAVVPIPPARTFFCTKDADWTPFTKHIDVLLHTTDLSQAASTNEAGSLIVRYIQTAAAENLVTSTYDHCRRPQPDWWNKACATAIAKLQKAKKRAFRTGQLSDLRETRRLAAIVKRTVKESKAKHIESYAVTVSSNTRLSSIWHLARSGRSKSSKPVPALLDSNGIFQMAPSDRCQLLLSCMLPCSPPSPLHVQFFSNIPVPPILSDQSYNQDFTLDELAEALASGKNGAPGPDGITYVMIRNMSSEALAHLLALFNRIWAEGLIPDDWKTATLLPLLKPTKDPHLPTSYRPIALNSCLLKLLEKMVHNRLYWLLETKALLPSWQHGFRKAKSTLDPLMELYEELCQARAKKLYSVVVFLDVEKAFDGVWHQAILGKLRSHGIHGKLYQFLENYLHNRTYCLSLNGYMHSANPTNGVPQGGVLSPTLFALVANDLPKDNPVSCKTFQYADDVTSKVSDRSLSHALRTMQASLNQMAEYGTIWGLSFSGIKSAAIIVSPDVSSPDPPPLVIKGVPIPYVSSHKWLGVWFSSNLSWNVHVKSTAATAAKRLNVIRYINSKYRGASRHCSLLLYKAIVRSTLDYASPLVANAPPLTLKPLDSVQNKAFRSILGVPCSTAIAAMEIEVNLPPLHLRRKLLLASFFAKNKAKSGFFASILMSGRPLRNFKSRPNGQRAMRALLQDLQSSEPVATAHAPPVMTDFPPWDFSPLPLNLHVNGHWLPGSKATFTAQELRTLFEIERDNLPETSLYFYTDGSKTLEPARCAIGIYDPVTAISFAHRLPDYFSIMTAELCAIRRALQLASTNSNNSVTIFTDSLSAVDCILQPKQRHSVAHDILTLTRQLRSVTVLWTPSHVSIHGNDIADISAQAGLSADEILNLPCPLSDALTSLRRGSHALWCRQWEQGLTGRLLYSIKPQPCHWSHIGQNRRIVDRLFGALRCRRVSTPDHLFMINKADSDQCRVCKVASTVPHLLLHCTQFSAQRTILKHAIFSLNLDFTIKVLLGGSSVCHGAQLQIQDAVLAFISNTVGVHNILF